MNYDRELIKKKSRWLDVKALARVEATSEDSRYPINSAFEEDGHGWRAVEVGDQIIQLRPLRGIFAIGIEYVKA